MVSKAETKTFLNAPFYNLDTKTHLEEKERTEVTITDPRHPLFKRTFPILSMSNPHFSQGHIYVIYREGVTLRIPLLSTDIIDNSYSSAIKLTRVSLEELVSLAEEYKILCPITLKKSGKSSPQMNSGKSSSN